MELGRKEDLSVYYFLKSILPTSINLEDGFPEKLLTLPTVSFETRDLVARKFEMGNHKRITPRSWYIDVFAQNKSQRDELVYKIVSALEDDIPVYDYDVGFPPETVPQIGCLEVDDINAQWVRVMPQLVDKMYYRAQIYFSATNTQV